MAENTQGQIAPPPPPGVQFSDAPPPPPSGVSFKEDSPPDQRGFWESLWDKVNPAPGVKEWLNRPEQIGHAMDALHVTRQAALRNPANKGKPPGQWVQTPETELTPEEKATVDKGFAANLPGAESNALGDLAAPGVEAAKQAAGGNYRGAAGTLAGGYAVPALAAAAIPKLPAATRIAKGAIEGAVEAPGVRTGALTGTALGGMIAGKEGAEIGGALGGGIPALRGAIKGGAKAYSNPVALPSVEAEQFGQGPVAAPGRQVPVEPPPPGAGRVPIWTGASPKPITAADFSPIKGSLPSGRLPGPAPPSPPPSLSPRSPIWAGIPTPTAPPITDVSPIPGNLPSGRIPGKPSTLPPKVTIPSESAYPMPEQPGAATTAAKESYQAAARTVKGRALARYLNIGGVPYEDAIRMTPEHWQMAAQDAGVNAPSEASIKVALDELKGLEAKKSGLPRKITPDQIQ